MIRCMRVLGITVLAAMTLSGQGCTSRAPDLVADGAMTLHRSTPKGLYVPWVTVRREEGGTAIYGSVRRRPSFNLMAAPHIEVTAVAADGTVLHRTEARCTPPLVPAKSARQSSFSARLPEAIPDKASIRVDVSYFKEPRSAVTSEQTQTEGRTSG